jgi:hypothetical protein
MTSARGTKMTRTRRYRVAAVAMVVGAIGASCTGSDPAMVRERLDADSLGIRANAGFFDQEEFERTEEWLGQPISYTVQFTGRKSPKAMNRATFGLLAAPDSTLPNVADRIDLVIAVALAFDETDDGTELSDPASALRLTTDGTYDDSYRRVARRLIEAGYPDAIIRLGHEFNGGWPPWSSVGNEAEFIAAWRHVHGVLREESPDFRFDWTSVRANWEETAPPAWPGDEFVDFVGMDVYWRRGRFNDERWQDDYIDNMIAQRDFAIEHDKPVSYPEWGIEGRDESRYIEAMYDWFVSLPDEGPGHLAYQSYFDGGGGFALANYPLAEARFRELFGSG